LNKLAISLFLLANAAACMHSIEVRAETDAKLAPDWRITRVVAAPRVTDNATPLTLRDWIGQRVTFHDDSVDGPGVLRCGHAVLEATSFSAEALFQGNLPAPAADSAQTLGISHFPVAGASLSCDTGLFELHRIEPETLLVGLDNQILTLSHTPGTLATAESPEGRTQRFLELHFGGDMGFTPTNLQAHRAWFSSQLNTAVSRYFARPSSPDEVPAIDGDPFTDSQEYPQRFAVGKASVTTDSTQVPVQFSDASAVRTVVYVLRKEGAAWQLDDLLFSDGETLLGLLK